jgi:hypothetical protein
MDGDHSVAAAFNLVEDGISQVFGNPTVLGTVPCGSTMTESGTTTQPGESKWLQFTMPSGCAQTKVTINGSGGETFEIDTAGPSLVFGGGLPERFLTTPATYYIRIYNDGAYTCGLGCGTGIWTITIAVI